MIKSLLFTKKHIMQCLLKKLHNLGIEYQKDENFETFKPILQFFVLIIDLCKNYQHYFSSSSPFYSCLKSMNFAVKSPLSTEETFKNHAILLETMKFSLFENSRVSKYLIGIFNVIVFHKLSINLYIKDPILIASGFIPEFFNILANKTLGLVNFTVRREFFKNLNFPLSRALYFIYHVKKKL